MKSLMNIAILLLISTALNSQNCPDNINTSPGNSSNSIQADVYNGDGEFVETITCQSTGNSNQLDCDLESYGYPSNYFIILDVSNGSNSTSCAYGADGELIENNPLPVELLDFEAITKNDEHILNWTTASENQNDYFTVESSIDLNIWNTIGTVKGAGTDSQENEYTLKNDKIVPGITYYRLTQTDFSGFRTKMSIISIETAGSTISNKENVLSVQSTKTIKNVKCYSITGSCISDSRVDAKDVEILKSNIDSSSIVIVFVEFMDGEIMSDKIIL